MTNSLPALSESRTLRATAFFGLYVVEGIPSGFALTAVANYLAYRGLHPEVIAAFAARIGIPWTVQFVWGPVIDRFQGSPMGRRKPWVLGAQFAAFLASLGLLLVRDPATQVMATSLAFLVHGLFASVQDASVDAMAISLIPESERGRVNAFMRAGLLVGSGVGAAAWAVLMRRYGFFHAALAQSLVLLAMTALTAMVRERPGDSLVPWGRRRGEGPAPTTAPTPDLRAVFGGLFRGLLAPRSLVIFGLVLLVYTFAAVFVRAFSFHLIGTLGWTDEESSVWSGTYGTAAGLATALLGAVIADRIGPKRLMVVMMAVIAGFLLAFCAAGGLWAHRSVAGGGLILWSTFDPAFSIACMPVLMSLCRPGVEGSQFTAYMAMVNLANALGTYASGLAEMSYSAPTIGLACGLAIAAGIPVAAWALGDRREPAPLTASPS